MSDLVDGLFSALSYPQRKLKEAVSGSEEEWMSPEGWSDSPNAYAAINTAADLIADPLNLIGAGMFTKGAKGLRAAAGKAKEMNMATKTQPVTMIAAGMDNYIDDFYGIPKSRVDEALKSMSPAERMLVDTVIPKLRENPELMAKIPKVRNLGNTTREEDLMAVRKMLNTGLMLTGATERGLKDLISPGARALWREHGITPAGQANLKKNLDKFFSGDNKRGLENKNIQKATSIVHMMSHMGAQGGRVGAVSPDMQKIMKMSTREDYAPYSAGRLSEWFSRNTDAVDPAEAKVFEEQVLGAWKNDLPSGTPDLVIMKAPRNKMSGDHASDIIANVRHQNPVAGHFSKFQGGDINDLRNHMDAGRFTKDGKRNYVVMDNVNDPEGVWIRSSRVGNAVTEGGIGIVTRVKPNGDMSAIMGDVHNFLENVPVVGQAARVATPLSLLAVSPVVKRNIFDKTKFKGGNPGGQISNEGALDTLQAIQNQKPSQAAVDIVRAEDKALGQQVQATGLFGLGTLDDSERQ